MRNKHKDNIAIILFNKEEFKTFTQDLKRAVESHTYDNKEIFKNKYNYGTHKCILYGELNELFTYQGVKEDKNITRNLNILFEKHDYKCTLHDCKHKTLTDYIQCFIISLFGDIKDNETHVSLFKSDITQDKISNIIKSIKEDERNCKSDKANH